MGTEQLFSNLLTVAILLILAIIIYLKVTNKTLTDFVKEIKDIFPSTDEEVLQ